MSLLDQVYLPDLQKRTIRDSDAYKLLKDNKLDASILEGYEKEKTHEPFEVPSFNTQEDKDRFVEDNASAAASSAKEYLETFGNFLTEETDDLVTSLSLAAVNGADVATNLMPLFYTMMKNTNLGMTMPSEFWSPNSEGKVMEVAQHWSSNLGEYRKQLQEKQKDNGWVKDILSYVVQDSVYSVPAYKYMRKLGVPKYPAFFLSAAMGAIGVENVDRDGDKTYFDPLAKDIIELKRLIGILPDTPADKIADEVTQALEYGTFGAAIPGIIDAFKFMKRYIPHFAAGTGGSIGMFADNEAEGTPLKTIIKAVDKAPMFKSAVVDAAEKIPATASGDQIYKTILNTSGVKQSELKWMDLEGFLKGKKKVTKNEVLNFIDENRIDVTEAKLSASTSMANSKSLPRELQAQINDYEMRWRDSDLATELGTPNYDRYNFKITNYASGAAVNQLGEPTQATVRALASETGEDVATNVLDWQSINRSPLIQAMDDDLGLVGDAAEKFNIKDYNLKSQPWFDEDTGKFTAHVVDVSEDIEIDVRKMGYQNYIVDDKLRVVIPSVSLEGFEKGTFTKIAKYELEPLELERFLLEDRSRNFRLNNTDQMPVFGTYTEAGGEDYTELIFKIKNKDRTTPAILEGEFGSLAGNKVKSEMKTTIDYMSPHFNRPNEFAHVRFKTRTLPNGKKAIVVEEMQSDLFQASKTEMFMSAKGNKTPGTEKFLKDFPFKNNWYEFTIKRLTRYAADNGFDAIAVPKGSLAANRYGQNIMEVDALIIDRAPNDDRYLDLKWIDFDGNVIKDERLFAEEDVIGALKKFRKDIPEKYYPEVQSRAMEVLDEGKSFSVEFETDKIVGTGKGKFALYDKTIPSYMKKYAKKWNAKVYDDNIVLVPEADRPNPNLSSVRNFELPVTVLELSDEMKKDVVTSSQPLFELFGAVSLSTWMANEVSDSMENNIISTSTENMY